MSSGPEPRGSPSVEHLTPEEASRIIHSHRKVRYGTACWPCRQRKVKCDNKSPCENCEKREHPQLCSYKPNRTATGKPISSDCPGLVASKKRARSPGGPDSRDQSNEAGEGISADDAENAETTRYVGQNSIPALLREQTSVNEHNEGNEIRRDMRSLLGLDNSAPFPLMSSRHLNCLTLDISSELPSDREVMKLFRTYKEIPQPFWGFVIDIDDLESRLMVYLEDRAKNARASTKSTKSVSASWLAVLFAVLAVGSQYHDSPYHVRTRDAQKYIQISFHFLRAGNFLLRPNLDSIQALLMTCFVLVNDMKAEASWALLGLTCRLAQSLGLHKAQHLDGRQCPDAVKKEMARRKLWWTCRWHDTLTSLSFDRPPMTNMPCCPIPMSPNADTDGWAYLEAMFNLVYFISSRLNPDALATVTYAQILDNCEAVENIRNKLAVHLRNKEMCRSALDRLQYFAIRLHTSFVISVCCRPALMRRESNHLDDAQRKFLADRCKKNLAETVRMFLAMHQLSVIPTRSWAFTYHGLSSALLLGILGEAKTDPEVRQLQGDLIAALSATAASEQTSPPQPQVRRTDLDIELSGPLSRALEALKNIYDHGSVVGPQVKRERSISGATSVPRTPLPYAQPPGALGSSGAPISDVRSVPATALDAHQNAALAMTELQQQGAASAATTEFSSSAPYSQPPPASGPALPEISIGFDQAYMSPMDLYDSIFWGE